MIDEGCTWYNVLAKHPNDYIREEQKRFEATRDMWIKTTVSRQALGVFGFPVAALSDN